VEIVDPTVPNGGSVAPEPAQTFPRNGIDLPDIAFGAQTTLAYAKHVADTGGTLTVSDGRHAASVALLGSYIAGSFVIAADGHGGTLLTAAEQTQAAAAYASAARLMGLGLIPAATQVVSRSSSQTLSGIGRPANISRVGGFSGAMPSVSSTITSWRTCWPECQVVRSRYSCKVTSP